MYELNGARFVERYVLTSIQNGSQPAPLNEPCLVHDLFQEIHGKPNTVEILANSVLSNCDVLLLPNNQLTDDEQMYSFLLDEMENLRWLFNNITNISFRFFAFTFAFDRKISKAQKMTTFLLTNHALKRKIESQRVCHKSTIFKESIIWLPLPNEGKPSELRCH